MNKENIKLLVEDLRSGKHKQTKRRLRNILSNGYCCLGRACEVFMQHNPNVIETKIDELTKTFYYAGEAAVLPEVVAKWYGFATFTGWFKLENGGRCSLVSLNDNGRTFAEIADVIESNPEGLFENVDASQL